MPSTLHIWSAIFFPRDALHERCLCRRNVFVCLSVTRRYCIETDRYHQTFLPSGSSITVVFEPLASVSNSKGKPFSGGAKYKEVENVRFSSCRYFCLSLYDRAEQRRTSCRYFSLPRMIKRFFCHYFRILPQNPHYTSSHEYFNELVGR